MLFLLWATHVRFDLTMQAIKSIAIARQYVEEEAIDLCCRPEFVEITEGDGDNTTSALRLLVLVEQT